MKKQIHLCIILFLSLTFQLQAQEICNNAIDDDGDGLVDINDEDCMCEALIPSSLIPNPSFEDMTCCPMENERLDCAVGWIQASAPTTDYVHTCGGYLGNVSIPAFAPLPFADGEGGVGFRDGQADVGPSYKEYVGACLTEIMEVGATYRFDFFVGFQDDVPGSTEFKIALFASTNCGNLPFGGNNYTIGCPVNAGGYTELGEQQVSGSNEWVNVIFEFVADQPYEVIVLGPSCSTNPNYLQDPYFYVDRLAIAESSEFGFPFESVSGSICENDLVLQVEENPENTYQWYQDGVALIGETNSSLLLTAIDNTEGTYLVVITTPEGCTPSQEYKLLIPPYYAPIFTSICEDEYFLIDQDTFTQQGYYETLLQAVDGCDSIVQLTLDIDFISYSEWQDTFCEETIYTLHDISTSEGGIYETILVNAAGCDSIVTVNLSQINLGIGLDLGETMTINLGESIDLVPNFYDFSFTDFLWWDSEGNEIGNTLRIPGYTPVFSTKIFIEAFNSFACSVTDSMDIEVLPNHIMYVPNAFSPDGNGINDFFRFYPPLSVASVRSFSIFDRWGGLAFRDENITNVSSYLGWDGKVNGEDAQVGVYCYMLQVSFLDGTEKLLSGDVTLFR